MLERRNPSPLAGGDGASGVIGGKLDALEDTPNRRISQPTAQAPALPPGLAAGSIVARHFFGVVDSVPLMGAPR